MLSGSSRALTINYINLSQFHTDCQYYTVNSMPKWQWIRFFLFRLVLSFTIQTKAFGSYLTWSMCHVRGIAERFKKKRINFLHSIEKKAPTPNGMYFHTRVCERTCIKAVCDSVLNPFCFVFFFTFIFFYRYFLMYACVSVCVCGCVDSFIHRQVNGKKKVFDTNECIRKSNKCIFCYHDKE